MYRPSIYSTFFCISDTWVWFSSYWRTALTMTPWIKPRNPSPLSFGLKSSCNRAMPTSPEMNRVGPETHKVERRYSRVWSRASWTLCLTRAWNVWRPVCWGNIGCPSRATICHPTLLSSWRSIDIAASGSFCPRVEFTATFKINLGMSRSRCRD